MKIGWSSTPLPVLLLVATLVLAACEFRIHADLVIEDDETGTLSVELSMDEELAALAGSGFGGVVAIGEDMVPSGWAAELVSEGGYEGIRSSTGFESLDDLRGRLEDLVDEAGTAGTPLPAFLSDISPTRDGDTFIFRLVIPEAVEDLIGAGLEESPIPVDLATLDTVFDIRLTMVLPGELVTNNADVVTGETLIWNVSLTDAGRVLEAESELPGPDRTRFIAWAAIALALVIAAYIVVKLRKRRRAAVRDRAQGPPVSS